MSNFSVTISRLFKSAGFIAIAGLILVIAESAQAQFNTGTIASAMGGAGRAAVDPGEAPFLNPASLSHTGRYFLSGSYGFGDHPQEGDFNQFAVLVADGNPENLVPGSFSYVRRRTDLPTGDKLTEQDLQLAIAGFALRSLSLGISGHRLYSKFSNVEYEQTNMNVGLLYTPTNWLGLSFNAYDVFRARQSVPVGTRLVPTFAIGSHFLIQEMFRIRLDLVRPDQSNPGHRTNVMTGIETYFRPDFAFRLGAQWRETAGQTYLTGGLGYRGPRLSFDYSIQRDVRNGEGIRHLFDLWLPI